MKKTMRSILILFSVCAIFSFAACKKADNSPKYVMIPDTGVYTVKTGTVTVNAPEGTFIFDTSQQDVIIIDRGAPIGTFIIGCFSNKYGNLGLIIPGTPVSNATFNLSDMYLQEGTLKTPYYQSYPGANIGTVSLVNYNTNGIAAAGSFTAMVGQVSSINNLQPNGSYPITGTFDLKLTPR